MLGRHAWRSWWNARIVAFLAATTLAIGIGAAPAIRPALLALLFTILCALAAGLLLAQSVAISPKTAMRVALGAGRTRLAAHYFTRSLPAALAGAAAGIVLRLMLTRGVVSTVVEHVSDADELAVDWTMVFSAAGAACLASVLASLTPFWQALRAHEPTAVPLGTLISEFTDSVRRAGSVRDAMGASLSALQERTSASSVMLLEKAGEEYRSATCSIPARGLLLNRLKYYRHALPVLHFDTWLRWARESRPEHVAEIETLAATGVHVAVPLRAKNEILGVLLLGPPAGRERYTTAERQVLSNSAEVLALMLENARLIDREVEQEALRRDLAMAAEVQKLLLPPQPPQGKAATFAAFTLPARTVGGDYYDFLDLGDERIGIAVADVSGKGIPAALLMSVVQASLRVISTERNLTPSQLASKMNGFLYQSTGTNRYATFFYAQIDDEGRRLRYVNAGHNPPYLLRQEGTALHIVELRAGGTVLGLFPEVAYEDAQTDLHPGDVVVAFTDGLIDAVNGEGEDFGEERLKDVLRGTMGTPADEIATRLASAVREWIGDAEQHDDVTFVVVAIHARR